MSNIGKTFALIDEWIWRILKYAAMICIVVLFVLLLGNVTVRVFKLGSFGWFDEIVEMAFAYLVFCGAAALCRESEHFKIEWLEDKLEGTRAIDVITLVVNIITLGFFVLFFLSGLRLASRARDVTAILHIRRTILYASLPAAGVGMVYYSLRVVIRSAASLFRRNPGSTAEE